MPWHIAGSVGRWEKHALNRRADVETVQTLLTAAASRLANPALDPRGVDGAIAKPPVTSNTIKAIEAFQSRFMAAPDGLVAVNGRTFRELVAAAALAAAAGPGLPAGVFPFRAVPSRSWTSAPRAFGANRHGQAGPRAPAGCDLYAPLGPPIHAIADGTVRASPRPFYARTDSLEVDHGDFLARYCEIRPGATLRKGDRVRAGDVIAHVGHLVGITVPSDMLHLELYADPDDTRPLSTNAAGSKKHANGRLFYRRPDLLDPTPFLNDWRARLP